MTARYLIGDVLEVLPTLEPGSVDLVLTSPPFLALRSYLPSDHPLKAKEGGSQPTPGAYIDWLVDVVEALDRVLAPHGSMVIELGDTYAGSGGAGGDYDPGGWRDGQNGFRQRYEPGTRSSVYDYRSADGWPASKSLTLIPELFRMTLVYGFNPLTGRQTRRWRLRNVIRWVRPNPPVGALGDKFRPATSELMVFCRTDEAGRRRYFDLDAVREAPGNGQRNSERSWDNAGRAEWGTREHTGFRGWHDEPVDSDRTLSHPAGAPPLDWWNIPPGGYQGAHYAVFPEALCVRPIKAMCPERVCRTCGEPSRRIVSTERAMLYGVSESDNHRQLAAHGRTLNNYTSEGHTTFTTLGWSDCGHNSCEMCGETGLVEARFIDKPHGEPIPIPCPSCGSSGLADNYRPGLVLDPFAGSGTTLAVAVGHGRDAIGIDLDERNLELARGRLGMFLEEAYR